MKISLVLSTYNGQDYILEQLQSIMEQTLAPDEVLIFDDCSTDDTVNLVTAFLADHTLTNWHLSVNPTNVGWRRNFMDGIRQASGKYIFTCDQDDIWQNDKIEKMVAVMDGCADILLLTSGFTEFYPDGRIVDRTQKQTEYLTKQNVRCNFMGIPYPGCTYCIRDTLAQVSAKYWRSDFPHDSLLWRLAMFSDGLYTLNLPLIRMRKHSDSAFATEARRAKDRKKKRASLDYEERAFYNLQEFIAEEAMVTQKEEKLRIVEDCLAWNALRKKFYDEKRLSVGIRLMRYRKFYPNFKRYLGDWLWGFLKG